MKKNLAIIFGIITIIILALLGMRFLPAKVMTDTKVSGIYFLSQEWRGVITVTEDVTFVPPARLIVTPGTRVLFEKKSEVTDTVSSKNANGTIQEGEDPTDSKEYDQAHFHIKGTIIAQGTKNLPIIFTPKTSEPGYADWDQLILKKNSVIEYAEVGYAHNGITIQGKNVVIKNSIVHHSLWSCINVNTNGAIIENNEIFACWHQAIRVETGNVSVIRKNIIHDAMMSVRCLAAKPTIEENTFTNAPIDSACSAAASNVEKDGQILFDGGTYNGQMLYKAPTVSSDKKE